MRGKALGVLLSAATVLSAAGVAHATSAGDMIGYLNAQRAANGFPAGITENVEWSLACAKHNSYDKQNNTIEHSEASGKPGYTSEGAAIAGQSVLYQGKAWTTGANPFEWAPIHLSQVLQPRLDVIGADETSGYGCATTFPSRNRPDPTADVVYPYPGDGASGVYADEVASEGPYAPGETVGLAKGAHTGPYLLAFLDGPGLDPFAKASVTCAQLVGPDGPVDVIATDSSNPQLAGFLPPEVMVIPRSPLRQNATYAAAIAAIVTPANGGPLRPFVRAWSFKTGQGGGAAPSASCPAPDISAGVPAPGSTVKTGTGKSGSAHKVLIAFPSTNGRPSTLMIAVEPAAVGHPARLKVRVVKRKCAGATCRYLLNGGSSTRTITALTAHVTVKVPRHAKGRYVEVTLSIPTFHGSDGTRYATTTLMRRYR